MSKPNDPDVNQMTGRGGSWSIASVNGSPLPWTNGWPTTTASRRMIRQPYRISIHYLRQVHNHLFT